MKQVKYIESREVKDEIDGVWYDHTNLKGLENVEYLSRLGNRWTPAGHPAWEETLKYRAPNPHYKEPEMESKRHKWADVIIAWVNGEEIQFKNDCGVWVDLSTSKSNPISNPGWDWRIKGSTIMIGDIEVPQAEKNPLTHGTKYFIPSFGTDIGATSLLWSNFESDLRWLKRGMIHLTLESAVTHAKALIKISGGSID